MSKVSIIIPTYNYAQFIEKTLKSVSSQTYKDFEVIVVDDGSKDNTEAIVKKFSSNQGKKIKIKYIKHRKNLGFAKAMTTGVKHATSEYLNFLSADDILLPHFLEKEVEVLEKNPNVVIVYSPVTFISEDGRETGKQTLQKWQILKDSYSSLIIGNHINLVTCLARKKLLKACGPFNPKLKQMPDWDMWLRLSRKGEIAYVPDYLALYRIHKASLTGEIRRNFENIGGERKIILNETIKKNGVPKDLKVWLPLLFLDAKLSNVYLPKIISKPILLSGLGISVLTARFLRRRFTV